MSDQGISEQIKAPHLPNRVKYDSLVQVLTKAVRRTDYTDEHHLAFQKINKNCLSYKEVFDTVFNKRMNRVIYQGKILPCLDEIDAIVQYYRKETIGDGAFKLADLIRGVYAGISKNRIQDIINQDEEQSKLKPLFQNQAPLKPILASNVQRRHQIDLVSFENHECESNGHTYKYVVSILDVFSRFLWLRPTSSKKASEIARIASSIYAEFGPPAIMQCDNGGEFKAEFQTLMDSYNTKVIRSSPYRPQSQGKIERSHGGWKLKLTRQISSSESDWVELLPECARLVNQSIHRALGKSPFEVFYGRVSNRISNREVMSSNAVDEEFWVLDDSADEEHDINREASLQTHFENVASIRASAAEKDRKAMFTMVTKHAKKRPPSEYQPGDQVLVRTGKKSRFRKQTPQNAEVIEADQENFRYKILLRDPATGVSRELWLGVNDITSVTRDKEQVKQKKVKTKGPSYIKRCKCADPLCVRTPSAMCMNGMALKCCKLNIVATLKPCPVHRKNTEKSRAEDGRVLKSCLVASDRDELSLAEDPELSLAEDPEILAEDPELSLAEDQKTVEERECQQGNIEGLHIDSAIHLHNVLKLSYNEEKEKQYLFEEVHKRLVSNCQSFGYKFRAKTPKDGNCFFAAVCDQLHRLNMNKNDQLRADIVHHIQNRVAIDEKFEEFVLHYSLAAGFDDIKGYLEDMSTDGTWADGIVVDEMAKMLKTDLHIVLSSEQGYVAGYNILIKEGGEGPPILLGHYHESHYQSLDMCDSIVQKDHQETNSNFVAQGSSPKGVTKNNLSKGVTKRGKSRPRATQQEMANSKEEEYYQRPYKSCVRFDALLDDLDTEAVEDNFQMELAAVKEELKRICILDSRISTECKDNVLTFQTWRGLGRQRTKGFGKKYIDNPNLLLLSDKLAELCIVEKCASAGNVYVHPIPTKQFKWPVCRMLQEKFNVCDEYCLQFVQEVLVKEAVVLVFAARTGISTQEIRNICTSTEESLNLSGKVL